MTAAYPNAQDLDAARARIMPHLHRTPLWRSSSLSAMTDREVYIKAELFQKTGSYKPRGMLNRLMALSDEERQRGVITFSSGNAAQGLAYGASIVGASATVVMPATASPVKAAATRGYGATVILHGAGREAFEFCQALARERGLTYVSPYDDMILMTGHASLGLEILDDLPDADALYVGVGGGGMIGGVALALLARESRAALIGAEPVGAPKMFRSLAQGHPVSLASVDTIADGLAPPDAGALCYPLVRDRARKVVLVEDAAIVEAMTLLMTRMKLYAEPSGAAALAAFLASVDETPPNAKVVCLVSGGNLDLGRLKNLLP